ncbi:MULTISPECIES: FAD-dependent oxidoreductase [unclassified Lactobacillus]|uniref:FAD-dependent oxidoreductase n=1 Tax=unclassified Lactobacillus TaxID=2620435 RepID=UPI000EFBFEC4|nr:MULTISPECIES: FAD-dependent oxidoreductase [unclassified Lactobacillus]RMC24927.1 FAD-dependent oxidoreductase [Lactobacillus sp. ESL0247]RMC29082.1 FAD-dependent oxidoreductase [Lactobacillus sp. ESL0246]RMC32685.1 FAD-dependent oxidoreductase [Lactobacillus sp. ESL0245]
MSRLRSGKYSVVAKEYEGETMPLEVEIEEDKIQKITPQREATTGLEDIVFTTLSKKIIDSQSLDVDAVTGATHSSKGLIEAVGEVIEKAGGNKADYHLIETKLNLADDDEFVSDTKLNKKEYAEWRKVPEKVDKEINTDFLIVGAGIAGLASAVQARQEGLDTLVIEKNGFVAGNGGGVEGIFGINTKLQKEAGIHAEPEDIIAKEAELGQYRVDGSFWVDLIKNSADNINWLIDLGVQLTIVDDYHGTCMFPTFHWFKGGFASIGYVPYMKKKADELGSKFMLDTSAISAIDENGVIKGVYAKTTDGIVKINAKATLLATGGVGHSAKLIRKQGWSTKNLHYCSMPSNTGDGYQMAMSLGAKDMLKESPEFMMNYIQALPHEGVHLYIDPINGFMSLPSGGPVVFVNQNGRRFVNENVKKYNLLYQRMAIKSTKVTYEIFTQDIYDQITKGVKDADKILAKAVKTNEGDSLYKADTVENLAKAVSLPVEQVVETIKQYNKCAVAGKDAEFNKDKETLIPINRAPYYIARLDPSNLIGIGGVGSNQKFEVIDDKFEKIPGLYVVGMDSTMQYRDVYTITLGGSACAHDINSGRHAAMNAKEYIKSI